MMVILRTNLVSKVGKLLQLLSTKVLKLEKSTKQSKFKNNIDVFMIKSDF